MISPNRKKLVLLLIGIGFGSILWGIAFMLITGDITPIQAMIVILMLTNIPLFFIDGINIEITVHKKYIDDDK